MSYIKLHRKSEGKKEVISRPTTDEDAARSYDLNIIMHALSKSEQTHDNSSLAYDLPIEL